MPGFKCFTQPPVVVQPTIKEKIVALPQATKQAVLNAYIVGKQYNVLAIETGMDETLLRTVYELIDAIQERSAQNLRGEIVVTPAVMEGGAVVIPAVMNAPATTQAGLVTAISPEFLEYFTSAIITAVVGAMVSWSKYDNSGTFAFYKSQVIL